MFVGIFVNLVSWSVARTGQPCMFRYDLFYLAVAMYGSYAILFSNFFYQRYIKKSYGKTGRKTGTVHPETIPGLDSKMANGDSVGNGGAAWKNGYHSEGGVKLKQH